MRRINGQVLRVRAVKSRDSRSKATSRDIPARNPCGVTGCTEITTERKPYCISHLDRLPHVKAMQAAIAERDAEEDIATTRNGWKCLDVNGSKAKELVAQLAVKGAQTPKRLAISVEMPPEATNAYLTALEAAGLVEVLTLGSRRGTPRMVASLTPKGMDLATKDLR